MSKIKVGDTVCYVSKSGYMGKYTSPSTAIILEKLSEEDFIIGYFGKNNKRLTIRKTILEILPVQTMKKQTKELKLAFAS